MGKVQGVWYRSWFQKEAKKLGITGYIKNLENKQIVEAVIQGSDNSINKIIKLCQIGPPMAQVNKLFKEKISNEYIFSDFIIK